MIDEIFEKFDGAFAENTIRAYRSDFEQYSKWCVTKNVPPIPATADNLAMYVDDQSHTCKSATIRRRMNSLGTIFKLSRNPDPTKDPAVVLAIKRMHRKIGRQQTQATPLTRHKLEELLNKCPGSMRGLRNQVLLLLGYETMRRRAELCAFRFEDLTDLAGRGAALRLVKSKTDQEGVTKLIPLSPRLKEKIALWQNYAKIDGVILRSVDRHGNVGPKLNAGAIGPIINSMTNANIASERAVQYSGRSFRVGAALDLLDQNETLDRIMLRGGWKTESSVMRYLQLMSL